MKVCVAALAVLTSAAFCSLASSAPLGSDMPISCCFAHTARQIPRSMVVDYYDTSSKCSLPAIKGRALCANPSNSWVQAYVTHLDLN
ncbi:C-C motif chemokine 4-like isoform X2 [Eretmochelys imbricata]